MPKGKGSFPPPRLLIVDTGKQAVPGERRWKPFDFSSVLAHLNPFVSSRAFAS